MSCWDYSDKAWRLFERTKGYTDELSYLQKVTFMPAKR